MLKVLKLTARQTVLRYTAAHGLTVTGSEAHQNIMVADKQGHWSEMWTLRADTWVEVQAKLAEIEVAYWDAMTRPWEVARRTYTGTLKADAPTL